MRFLLLTGAALLCSAPAFATSPRTPQQPGTTNQAAAAAAAVGVGVGVGIGHGGAAHATGGTASTTGTVRGGDTSVAVQNGTGRDRLQAPAVQAPAIWSNNPCVVALSGGVSVAGVGASFGAGIEDRDCTRRANALQLHAMGESTAAREVLCENAEVRAAFARTGRPCAADQRPQPPMASVAYREVIGGGAPTPRRALPAYCSIPGIGNPECR